MPRLTAVLAALVLTAVGACRPAHAPATRRVGMVASIAGVVGMMATAIGQSYANSDEMLAVFSVMSGGGIVIFAVGELSQPPRGARQETEQEKFRRWAKILASRAAGAAREGRCPRVRRLEKRVHVYDREVHDFVFMRDPAILKCLGGASPGLTTEGAEPGRPVPLTPRDAAPGDPTLPADPAAPTAPAAPADPSHPPILPSPVDEIDPPTLRLPPGTVIPPTP